MTSVLARDGLRILFVCAMFPFPPRSGYATRVYQLLRQLSSRHKVTLLSYVTANDEPNVERLRTEFRVETVQRNLAGRNRKRWNQLSSLVSSQPSLCRATYSDEMQRVIDRLCAREDFDLIHLESTLVRVFRLPVGTPVVLDEQNIDYELFERMRDSQRSLLRRWFYTLEALRFRQFERGTWRHVSGCALTSEREEKIVREYAPGISTAVVPNAVDLDYFRPMSGPIDRESILFTGLLDYRPNLEAAHHLITDILPLLAGERPNVHLTIVGKGAPSVLAKFRQPRVDVTGEVPDLRPYLQRATVIVVPIRTGSGTRLKVLEGLAMGKPIVSTTLGCEGINVRPGEHLLIGDTPHAFAAAVTKLFDDPSLAQTLGLAGRALIESEYSWEIAGKRLDQLYRQAITRTADCRGAAERRERQPLTPARPQ
jgi:sugar transferase (PEP-CTERM/EpsH1 system associated)